MGVDEHRQHAVRLVQFDETHSTHVSREVEDVAGIARCGTTSREVLKVEHTVVDVREPLVPLIGRFDVYRPDPLVSPSSQFGHEVTTDETASPGDKGEVSAIE